MLVPAHRRSRQRAFTLVELLVVIGIIAILISVLLPVLGSARKAAAKVKCLSNLRNIHNAFLMYAGDFKNTMPCGRQDDEDPVTGPINQNNTYWSDKIYPYLLRRAVPLNAFGKDDADAYMKSVLWCPTWQGDHPEIYVYNPGDAAAYSNRFKTGYGYNHNLGFRPDYPKPDANLPSGKHAMRASGFYLPNFGKYYKRNEITQSGDRIIVADSNLWIIGLNITDAAGTMGAQYSYPPGGIEGAGSPAGATNLDRYRHGKYPQVNGARFAATGGTISYNVLYLDGHGASLNSASDGYKGIRMRYP